LLEGKNVNLRIMEKEDLPIILEWTNDLELRGEYEPIEQMGMKELEEWYDKPRPDEKWFIIEKKNKSKVGQVFYMPSGPCFEIGYRLLPKERGKGYCTEAVKIIVDYLFLTRSMVRIQAHTNPKNLASHRVLAKAGFQKEGQIRKPIFIRGAWQDGVLYGILREEWREPKILTKKS